MRCRSATSASRGTFSRMSVSSVSRLAIISGSVAFLAPEIGIEPLSLRPPLMRIRSIAPRFVSGQETFMRRKRSSVSISGREAVPTRRGLAAPIQPLNTPRREGPLWTFRPTLQSLGCAQVAPAESLLGVDSGGIVGFCPHLLLAAPFLCFAALEVVTQRRGQTPLRHRLFLLFCPLAHTDRLRLRRPCGKDRRRFRRRAPPVGALTLTPLSAAVAQW